MIRDGCQERGQAAAATLARRWPAVCAFMLGMISAACGDTSLPAVRAGDEWTTGSTDVVGGSRVALANLANERSVCGGRVRSTLQLRRAAEGCEALAADATEQLDVVRRWRKAELTADENAAVDELELKATADKEVARQDLEARRLELPTVPIGDSDLSVSLQAFVGLVRVTFGKTGQGQPDEIRLLSGLGTGVKLRWDGYDSNGHRFEKLGGNVGVFYEPTGASSDQSKDPLRGSLAALLVLSTFEHVYLGGGWRFASTEAGFERGLSQPNFILVLGLGADGRAL